MLDLRDWPLPIFAETFATVGDPRNPTFSAPVVRRWNDKIAEGDAYVFVTPEYNHSVPAVLKNAIDSVFATFAFRNKAGVNADGVRDRRATSSALGLVGPSLMVRIVMRPLTKMLNPLVRKLAGGRHFSIAAQVHHLGRRSGRMYVAPVGARLVDDTFVIPLTFGDQSDWSLNVRAAGSCAIRLGGRDYQAVQPELLSAWEARPLVRAGFGPVERLSFRMLGIRQFMRLQSIPNHLEPIQEDQ